MEILYDALSVGKDNMVPNSFLTSGAMMLAVTSLPGGGGDGDEGRVVMPASDPALTNTRFIVQKILCPLVVVFGIVGNAITVAVLTRPSMRSSTSIYLTVLSLCDTIYLLFAFLLSLRHYPPVLNSLYYLAFEQLFASRMANVASNAGVCVIVTFTVERYLAIRYPLQTMTWNTPRRALIISLIVCTAAIVITVPNFAEMYAVLVVDSTTNVTRIDLHETAMSRSASYTIGYIYLVQTLFTFLPLIVLFLFNSLLVRHVFRAKRQRRQLADGRSRQQQQEQNSITVTLIAIVIVFLCCQLPQALLYFYKAHFVPSDRPSPSNVLIAGNICNILVMGNAASNFLLFSFFSSRFRATFYHFFCPKPVNPRTSTTSTLLVSATRIAQTSSVVRTA